MCWFEEHYQKHFNQEEIQNHMQPLAGLGEFGNLESFDVRYSFLYFFNEEGKLNRENQIVTRT